MKPEYFPPKEDIILQNEAPTDLYVLVTGVVVRIPLSLSLFVYLSIYLSIYMIYLCQRHSKIGHILQIITIQNSRIYSCFCFVLFFGLSGFLY